MFLNITVWVEEKYVGDIASVYFSLNKNEKIQSLMPQMIINPKDLKKDKTYVTLEIPYDIYIELLSVEKLRDMHKDGESFDELSLISNILKTAAEYKLESEVIYSALKFIKEDSSLSIKEAVERGYQEWIK